MDIDREDHILKLLSNQGLRVRRRRLAELKATLIERYQDTHSPLAMKAYAMTMMQWMDTNDEMRERGMNPGEVG